MFTLPYYIKVSLCFSISIENSNTMCTTLNLFESFFTILCTHFLEILISTKSYRNGTSSSIVLFCAIA